MSVASVDSESVGPYTVEPRQVEPRQGLTAAQVDGRLQRAFHAATGSSNGGGAAPPAGR